MNWMEFLLLQEALRTPQAPHPALTKSTQKMKGKFIEARNQIVKIDFFDVTDRGDHILFSITRTVDGESSTSTITSLLGKSIRTSLIDMDSNVTFRLCEAHITEYQYFTKETRSAIEHFKINSKNIKVR